MAKSKLDIWNAAMTTHLGVGKIDSLTATTPAAEQCKLHYDTALESLLESYWWTWARSRETLTELTNDRSSEWGYKYQMPAEVVSVRWVNEPETARGLISTGRSADTPREMHADYLYSDKADALMEYTTLVTDPSVWSQKFADALAAELASRCCQALTENARLRRDTSEASAMLLERAIVHDEQLIDTASEFAPIPHWLNLRGVT